MIAKPCCCCCCYCLFVCCDIFVFAVWDYSMHRGSYLQQPGHRPLQSFPQGFAQSREFQIAWQLACNINEGAFTWFVVEGIT